MAFALITWVYRLVVFHGIALLVCVFFFKLLGIALMVLELSRFIAKPVFKELAVWKAIKADIGAARIKGLIAIALVVLVVLFFPFSSRVTGFGWIHAPFAAQIVLGTTQRQFKTGDVLFVLDSSMLGIAQGKSRQLALARESQIAGLMGVPDGESQRQFLTSQKAFFEAEEQARLTLRAPFDGELHDVDDGLAPGVWVKSREPLTMPVDSSRR